MRKLMLPNIEKDSFDMRQQKNEDTNVKSIESMVLWTSKLNVTVRIDTLCVLKWIVAKDQVRLVTVERMQENVSLD